MIYSKNAWSFRVKVFNKYSGLAQKNRKDEHGKNLYSFCSQISTTNTSTQLNRKSLYEIDTKTEFINRGLTIVERKHYLNKILWVNESATN